MKTILSLAVVVASAMWSSAQVPPPAGPGVPPAPAVAPPSGSPSVRTGGTFFSRAGLTNRPTVAPGGPATLPPGTPPGTTVIPPRGPAVPGGVAPFGAPGAPGAPGAGGAAGANTNVVPKGYTDVLPVGMIRFQEADLNPILEFYADLTGRTVLRSPQVPANVKITLMNRTPLTIQEGIDALNTMLGLNNVTMIEEGAKFVKAVPSTTAGTEAPEFSPPGTELRDSKKIVAQIVQLKNITPEEVTGIIQPFASLGNSIIAVKGSPVLILRDYSENVKRMLELIEKIDVAMPLAIETVVIPIKYALASDVANVLSGLTAGGGGTLTFGSGSGGGALAGSSPGGMGTGMGSGLGNRGMGSSGFGSSGFGNTGTYPGGSSLNSGARPFGSSGMGSSGASGFGSSRTAFSGRLDNAVRRATSAAGSGGAAGDIQLIGNAKIIADERSNALLVFADKTDLPMITNIISKLDVVLPQVLIEALILEVNLSDGKSLGVSMSQNTQQSGKLTTAGGSVNGGFLDPNNINGLGSLVGAGGTNGSSAALSGFNYFGKYSKDFDFAVTAAANDSRINVLSRPRIQTSTAQAAQIFVGEQRPFITGSYFSDFGGSGSRSQYSLQDIGISLSVQPIINQEGLVTMTIAQDISQVGGTTKIDNNDVPITIHRQANAYVSVHDRDTIILGGFISTTKNKSSGGVPYLKDIPGLGMLFRSSTENISRVELVVLIRPTVLPTPEAAALEAASQRDRMPAVKRAEREEEEFAQKQLEKERREEQKALKKKY